MPEREVLSLVIVGQVGHGKSTLIGRLLFDAEALPPAKMEEIRRISHDLGHETEFAYVMDHLEEERRQEMTIDTAQAFFKTARRDYVIIDAPGHRDLLKNMVAGASQAQAAILVVDAAEGVCEQTRRHAHFLSMLGIGQVIVLVNKMDKAGYSEERFKEIVGEVGRFLKSVGIAPLQCIPGSALRGDNIDVRPADMSWYTGSTVLEALDDLQAKRDRSSDSLRLPIQDVYRDDGAPIYVGRVESGRLAKGQEILFLPSGAKARVGTIREFLGQRDSASSGECVGLVLEPAVEVDRGEVACPPDDPAPVRRSFRANVFWMSPTPCRVGDRLGVRAATQEVQCRVARIENRMDSSSLAVIEEEARELAETEIACVTFEAERPMVLEDQQTVPGLGRIVLTRGASAVGGGTVIGAAEH